MKTEWENDAQIHVRAEGDTVIVSANKSGLRSLAKQLLALAEETEGSHIHYDEYNALEKGSKELIAEKINSAQ